MNDQQNKLRVTRLFISRAIFIFVPLFIGSFSFPYRLLPDVGKYTNKFFEWMAVWTGSHVFNIHHSYTSELASDSTGLYLDLLNTMVISIVAAMIWTAFNKKQEGNSRLSYRFTAFTRYFLALHLLIYGFNKIFKTQFYLPEPNTLYTTIGGSSKDLLYWSTMGLSRPYTIFLGTVETIAAVLLLWRRTVMAGSLFAAMVLMNIVVINFSFDISVKLFSCFLLFLSIVLLLAQYKSWLNILLRKNNPATAWSPGWTRRRRKTFAWIKAMVIILLFAESTWVYFSAGNFNDDKAPRPPLHGAYHVQSFVINGDTLLPLLTDTTRWKMVFIHRRNYFIVQMMDDKMRDYELDLDTSKHEIYISRHEDPFQIPFSYRELPDNKLELEGEWNNHSIKVGLIKMDLKDLPAMKKGFNWTID
jgi:hypothetical protein